MLIYQIINAIHHVVMKVAVEVDGHMEVQAVANTAMDHHVDVVATNKFQFLI